MENIDKMEYELPTEFDLVVIGTGVVESIVAAAASRIGKRVMHVDSNNYYGGVWASFNLDAINKLQSKSVAKVKNINVDINEGEKLLPIGNNLFDIYNIEQTWHIPDKDIVENENKDNNESKSEKSDENNSEIKADIEIPDESKIKWTREKLLQESRRFNIDIAPKLQFARGDFVELLISSNIARYSEFRSVSRVLTWLNDHLEIAPCSRSDVFSNTNVSVIEKRMLMKLLTSCMDGDEKEFADYKNKTFKAFLKDKKLTPNLIHYILYAISMSTDETLCLEGVKNTKRFLNSLGRFGKTPFLYSMYGSGEITQAFCRLSAVFGGIYALNQTLNGLIFDEENNFTSLLCGRQKITAKYLVMGVDKAPEEFVKNVQKTAISRAVFITDRSIMESEKEHLTLLLFPPENDKALRIIIEMGTLTGTCPKDLYLVHMFTKQNTDPKDDFAHCVNKLFAREDENDSSKPKILWSFYYSVPDTTQSDLQNTIPTNVFLCPGPDIDLDYDLSIKQAKSIFNRMYPDLEFLPRAPDPEDIIIGDEDGENNNGESMETGDTVRQTLNEENIDDVPSEQN